jgi:hypothetical protein
VRQSTTFSPRLHSRHRVSFVRSCYTRTCSSFSTLRATLPASVVPLNSAHAAGTETKTIEGVSPLTVVKQRKSCIFHFASFSPQLHLLCLPTYPSFPPLLSNHHVPFATYSCLPFTFLVHTLAFIINHQPSPTPDLVRSLCLRATYSTFILQVSCSDCILSAHSSVLSPPSSIKHEQVTNRRQLRHQRDSDRHNAYHEDWSSHHSGT